VPFFAIHLMPVWIWLRNTLTASKRWKNTHYVVTNHRVLIRNGLAGSAYESVSFEDIAHVSVQESGVDKMMGVGDVFVSPDSSRIGASVRLAILDIEDYQRVYGMIQQAVADAKRISLH